MTAEKRLPLLALLWLLTAAAAGLLFAWLLREEPAARVEYREAKALPDSARGGEDPGGSGRSRDASNDRTLAAGSPSRGVGTPDATAAGGATDASPSPASILVTVLEPEGRPVQGGGTVYALSPGEPGTDDAEDLCRAEVAEDGTARLRLPGAGTYDVGARTAWGTTLAQDVRVPQGDAATLDLRLSGDAPVRVVCEPPWPPPVESPILRVSLWTAGEGFVDHPGRGQALSRGSEIDVGSDGTGTSPLLPSGASFSVSATFFETGLQLFADNEEGRRTPAAQKSLRYLPVPDRETVRPGETVRIRLQPVAVLVVEAEGEPWVPEGTDPRRAVGLRVEFSQGESRTLATLPVAGAAWKELFGERKGKPAVPFRPRLLFRGESGPCRLEWSGQGIRSGERDDVVLRAGEIVHGTIAFQADSSGREKPTPDYGNEPGDGEPVPEPEPLPIAIDGLPGDRQAMVYLLARDEEGEVDEYSEVTQTGEETGAPSSVEFTGVPRAGAVAVAVAPPDLASDPVPVPAAGSLRIALRPGGLLLVAPEEAYPTEFGRLRVRPADGRPFLIWEDDQRGTAEGPAEFAETGEAVVSAGAVLGPFPEGRIMFQVRLGGVRLPDATATVKAGRIEVLRIRR